jgi:hypothetical protein
MIKTLGRRGMHMLLTATALAFLALPPAAYGETPLTLSITPADAETPLGRQFTITAAVTDSDGQAPARSYRVMFEIPSPDRLHFESCVTANDGRCSISYTSALPGVEEIPAWVDVNGDGSRGGGIPPEPFASLTHTWIQPPAGSTPGCAVGAGTLQTNPRAGFAFAIRHRAGAQAPEGVLGFTDQSARKSLASGRITSLTIAGTHATIRGEGRTNGGQTVAFKVEVADRSANGRLDTFAIEWPGYSAAGTLRAGNIALSCPGGREGGTS